MVEPTTLEQSVILSEVRAIEQEWGAGKFAGGCRLIGDGALLMGGHLVTNPFTQYAYPPLFENASTQREEVIASSTDTEGNITLGEAETWTRSTLAQMNCDTVTRASPDFSRVWDSEWAYLSTSERQRHVQLLKNFENSARASWESAFANGQTPHATPDTLTAHAAYTWRTSSVGSYGLTATDERSLTIENASGDEQIAIGSQSPQTLFVTRASANLTRRRTVGSLLFYVPGRRDAQMPLTLAISSTLTNATAVLNIYVADPSTAAQNYPDKPDVSSIQSAPMPTWTRLATHTLSALNSPLSTLDVALPGSTMLLATLSCTAIDESDSPWTFPSETEAPTVQSTRKKNGSASVSLALSNS